MFSANTAADEEGPIAGNALRTYIYLYLNGENGVGARQVQHALGFTSPSSAIFQLEKLRHKGLVRKDSGGEYYLLKRYKIGILSDFLVVRSVVIPRFLLFAAIVSIMTTVVLVFFISFGTIEVVLAILPSVIASLVMWTEAYRIWKHRPKFVKRD